LSGKKECLTFLLVHGANHTSWIWGKLQAVLAADGWGTQTVDLPSAVKEESPPEPLPGVPEDAHVVREALESIDGPVVVVAHSYGGVPVTEATAEARNVVHIVYVASYLPDIGESMLKIHGIPVPDSLAGLRPFEDPDLDFPGAFFDGDLTNPETVSAIAHLVPQSIRADFGTVTKAGWKKIPSSYIIPDQDLSVVATVAERMAARAGAVYHVNGNHAPFYSNPAEFARLLTKIADGIAIEI
jgi:pimeloyl-ACP methyl ester carboxylesterase